MIAHKLDCNTKIPDLDMTLGDFWSWAYSEVMSNTTRSVFAEFLVGAALGVVDAPRIEWDAVDLRYHGKKIEVKASAFLQSWQQQQLSRVVFDIAQKEAWDAETNSYFPSKRRVADCYIFCLYSETDAAKANILDMVTWQFYVMPTEQIDQEFGNQRSISLGRLQQFCQPVAYPDLRSLVDKTLHP